MKITDYHEILPVIEHWVNYQAFKNQIPGFSIGILHEDKIILNKQYGLADLNKKEKLRPDHLFLCASHSKMFTTTAIMQLHEAQKLDIYETVQKYLPWFQSPKDPILNKITIFHLLTHTAGIVADKRLPNGRAPYNLDHLKEIVHHGISTHEPGQKIKYSNFAYSLLGAIIEQISGLSYEKFIINNILEPLNMTRSVMGLTEKHIDQIASGYTLWYPDRKREKINSYVSKTLDHIYTPVGGLLSTAEDLLKFWAAHFPGNEQLLSDSLKDEIIHNPVRIGKDYRAIGFEITEFPGEKNFCQIIGGTFGYRTQSGMLPEDKLAIAVLTNTTESYIEKYSAGIINLLQVIQNRWKEFQNTSKEDGVHPDYHELQQLYECPYGVHYFAQIGDKLTIFDMNADDPASTLIILEDKGDNRFNSPKTLFFAKENEPFSFKKGEDGIMDLYDSLGRKMNRFSFDSYCRL